MAAVFKSLNVPPEKKIASWVPILSTKSHGETQDFYSVRHFEFSLVIPSLTRFLWYEQKLDIRDLVFPRTGGLQGLCQSPIKISQKTCLL